MSKTDNAFIKVYQHLASAGPPRPVFAGPSQHNPERQPILVANENAELMQMVASASTSSLPLADTITTESQRTQTQPQSRAASSPATPTDRQSTNNKSRIDAPADTERQRWQDPGHAATPPPHVGPEKFQPSTGTPPTQKRFQAGWEVDSFRWPTVCDTLQREWASPLTGIVKSVVREAWRGSNIVGVTQFDRGEGATTIALCLARIAASFHIKVALVDGNQQKPDIASLLGLKFQHGWENTSVHCPIEESAIHSIEDRLVVVPLTSHGDSHFTTDQMQTVVERLGANFELVVVDTGPVFVAAHHWFAPEMRERIGSALVVRDMRRTETAQLDDACARIQSAGVHNISVVENFQFA